MSDLIKGLLTDYVNVLAKEHPTAARLVQAYANQELQQQETRQPVPDADPED